MRASKINAFLCVCESEVEEEEAMAHVCIFALYSSPNVDAMVFRCQ